MYGAHERERTVYELMGRFLPSDDIRMLSRVAPNEKNLHDYSIACTSKK